MSNTRRKYWVQFVTNNVAFPFSIALAVLMWFIAIAIFGVIGGFIGGVLVLAGIISSIFFIFWLTHHAGEWLHRWSYREDIRARHARATETLAAIRAGRPVRPFFVYLRSFRMENAQCLWYSTAVHVADDWESTAVDDELTHAFECAKADLICLGDDGTSKVGAARIKTSNSDWREIARTLMKQSAGIVIVPATTASVLEELSLIRSDPALRTKTALLMLPADSHLFSGVLWELMLEKSGVVALTFPKFHKSGMIFNFDGFAVPLHGNVSGPMDFASKILSVIPQRPAPSKA